MPFSQSFVVVHTGEVGKRETSRYLPFNVVLNPPGGVGYGPGAVEVREGKVLSEMQITTWGKKIKAAMYERI